MIFMKFWYDYTDCNPGIPREQWSELEGMGPNIDGVKPGDLIKKGLLTPETIKEEEKKIVYDDIMIGYTNDKNMLAKKLDLILTEKELINSIVANQYQLAIRQMEHEKRGYYDNGPRDRVFQFLATVKILMEKSYDIDQLKFKKDDDEIDLAKLLANFMKECSRNQAKTISDPSWFRTGEPPKDFDKRKVNNPWLFASTMVQEIYAKNPEGFKVKYEHYLQTTKRPAEERLSYEEFIHYAYGIDIPKENDSLKEFEKARATQRQQDINIRNQQLGVTPSLTNPVGIINVEPNNTNGENPKSK